MKITMYELLGLVKDGKIPEKIIFNGYEYLYHDKEHGYCRSAYDCTYICLDSEYYLFDILNDEVEILEEEKKIPEKLEIYEDEEGHYFIDKHCKKIYITCDEVNFMVEEFNQLIDYLKSKGDE